MSSASCRSVTVPVQNNIDHIKQKSITQTGDVFPVPLSRNPGPVPHTSRLRIYICDGAQPIEWT